MTEAPQWPLLKESSSDCTWSSPRMFKLLTLSQAQVHSGDIHFSYLYPQSSFLSLVFKTYTHRCDLEHRSSGKTKAFLTCFAFFSPQWSDTMATLQTAC